MKLVVTGNQINEALDALRYISGINEGDKKARFSFKPKAKIMIAKKLKMLNELATDLDDHRKKILSRMGITGVLDKDGKPVEDPLLLAAFHKEWSQFLAVEQDVDIGLIDEALLELGTEETAKNDIAAGFLSALDWLVAWTEEPAKA